MHQYTPKTRKDSYKQTQTKNLFKNCFQRLSFRIEHKSNSIEFIRTRSSVVVEMSQVETGIIFLFTNVKRFKKSFSVILLYIQL